MTTTAPEQPDFTLESAIGFTTLHASQPDLDRIASAIKQRSLALREARAASVSEGSLVRLGRIKPKYLVGLTGKVVDVRHGKVTRVVVEFDPASTEKLRYSSSRTLVPEGVERYSMDGIPASCCFPQ
ncbi:hypothetical protein ACIBUR_38825 [Streptomyces anulatus]